MVPPNRFVIADQLRAEVEKAKQQYNLALTAGRNMAALSSGIPGSDGVEMRSQAIRMESHWRNIYADTLNRFSRFLLDGKLPEDFKPQDERQKDNA